MKEPHAATTARRLGLSYAPAMVGFERKDGRSVPALVFVIVTANDTVHVHRIAVVVRCGYGMLQQNVYHSKRHTVHHMLCSYMVRCSAEWSIATYERARAGGCTYTHSVSHVCAHAGANAYACRLACVSVACMCVLNRLCIFVYSCVLVWFGFARKV